MSDALMAHDPAAHDELVLVDVADREIGAASKLACHREGLLHRAFSVMLLRMGEGGVDEALLVRRAEGKYHSGGLWTNSCCSHPRAGERLADAVRRRLAEELGVTGVACREVGSFVYRVCFANGLTEYEFDHVFVGRLEGKHVAPDPDEASEVRWVALDVLAREVTVHPERFTAWCPAVVSCVLRGA